MKKKLERECKQREDRAQKTDLPERDIPREETLSPTEEPKGIKERFAHLTRPMKIQFVLALILSLALVIGLPIYGWLALRQGVEAFTRIEEPTSIDIRAGHYDNIQFFNLNDIDIEEVAKGNPHRVVFSVSGGDYKISYQIQLAHTTNIPFVYEIYRATEYTSDNAPADPDVTYVSVPLKNQGKDEAGYTFYYKKTGENLLLTPMNVDSVSSSAYGRQLAQKDGKYYDSTYDEGDEPELYAVPIYEQTGVIRYDHNSAHDYFILEIRWDESATKTGNFADWNVAENKKETDVIYLTASRYTQ